MHITLSSEDLTKVRFEAAPLGETVASLRALQVGTPIHRPWIEVTKRRIAESPDPHARDHLRLLTALVPPKGFLADSITPTPKYQGTFAEGLAAVADVPPEVWQRDVTHLLSQNPADYAREELQRLAEDIETGIPRITAALEWYWSTAIEPVWPRLRSLLLADIDSRLAQLARDGILEVFKSLHPSVRPTPTGLEIMRGCEADDMPEPGGGLLLVPNAFVWPNTLVLNVRPFVPTLTYAPRGVGRLWEASREATHSPVARLLGKTRAQILAQLDVPMTTTQLARCLDLAAGTVNEHLKVMSESGLAATMRSGREVFYRRAETGEALLARL
ncbi:ArsR family transcriptional regulator [Arthrobacter sp. CAU 1506]|uniref:ArsR/SmtB family transcription factor n=1 Tax=Arthrobacter sp. CAU 1506 TaxID=2560052 RepID=UPI0010AD69C6|nr:helix-turn-helix domain-containing protein [Arthrobacter sp. CAU 1506]TJY69344.1 ArsR family transcriptional regulator [Arthrobacter sp. CAU 1506]